MPAHDLCEGEPHLPKKLCYPANLAPPTDYLDEVLPSLSLTSSP